MTSYRLGAGSRIDRRQPLNFSFDGVSYQGFVGDTLASALLANGVQVVARSFRLHRPRGVMSAGFEESNAIVQVASGAESEPNVRATQIPLVEGLEARAVNAWPSARHDLLGALSRFRQWLAPGFYYKTFFWPSWEPYSHVIRRLGGLGIAPQRRDGAEYAKAFEHCDVLVIGAGPAGLAAAREAARAGARTVLVDDKSRLGGSLAGETVEGQPAAAWIESVAQALKRLNVRVMTSCMAVGWYDHNLITLLQNCSPEAPLAQRQRLLKMRANRVVLATGALERPIVFPNNDRPGIVLASAAREYAVRYGVAVGQRAVFITNNDSAYDALHEYLDAGARAALVVDTRRHVDPRLLGALAERGVSSWLGFAPIDTAGRHGVSAVTLAPLDGNGRAILSDKVNVDCDAICVSGGWSPSIHLFSQSGGKLVYDAASRHFAPGAWVQSGVAAGAAAGVLSTQEAVETGANAGILAARGVVVSADAKDTASEERSEPWEYGKESGKPAWVDLQNDVTSEDIRLAAGENYRSVEHLKRYTTLGMALDQGKTSNVNGIGVLSETLGAPIPQVGTTRFRPPFVPISLGVLAGQCRGDRFHPLKELPTHEAQVSAGAILEEYGGWMRPAYYPQAGEDEEAAVRRESLHVRRAVGVFDASPLGKILVSGPEAGVLLDRIYVNTISTLAVGRCRYALMLNEHGGVIDDGVVQRLAQNQFLVGTTSSGADRICFWLEEWLQCEWPDLDVLIENVTTQWATLTVAGPHARLLMERVVDLETIRDEALPHMSVRMCDIAGVAGRVARVSFSGERSYELSVPAEFALALWRLLLQQGEPLAAQPYGIEAVMRLRLEKGFLHVGADTSSDTYPQDVGFAGPLRTKKVDFVGRRSTMRDAATDRRRQLVGLTPIVPGAEIHVGAHIVSASSKSEGWVTSSGYSPILGRWVAMAMLDDGPRRIGETLEIYDRGARTVVKVSPLCAYDPEGERLNA